MNLIDVAHELIAEGLNPLPLWNSKAPMLEAGHNFLYETITDVDSRILKAEKIGIACGLVSEFYCIDFDCHNGEPIKDTFDDFISVPSIKMLIKDGMLSCYTTAGGGYHVYFRSKETVVMLLWESRNCVAIGVSFFFSSALFSTQARKPHWLIGHVWLIGGII